jgi:hypothetical protein
MSRENHESLAHIGGSQTVNILGNGYSLGIMPKEQDARAREARIRANRDEDARNLGIAPQKRVPFKLKAPTEAICLMCFAAIRPAKGESVEAAEQRHISECGGPV